MLVFRDFTFHGELCLKDHNVYHRDHHSGCGNDSIVAVIGSAGLAIGLASRDVCRILSAAF